MQIDLRSNSIIPLELRDIYDSTTNQFRRTFNEIIEEVSKKHLGDIHWFITPPISRNPYGSNLFSNLCNLFYIDRLIEEKTQISDIIVESKIQKTIIKNYIKKK